ncbi:hypothetical protein TEQG_06365 [Trichophyton equinum CBS 127.97]|uniref:Uncharacterized protein n=1 Tax=Trichophyton equinum (strain ATCC MYA-4606 / CBS 127.97) TaxID=559882 RepID=F2PZR3_TRIEC|nr:hypothetical protein TEQG_06365 [Trichophyton equinum CBS 127.97]
MYTIWCTSGGTLPEYCGPDNKIPRLRALSTSMECMGMISPGLNPQSAKGSWSTEKAPICTPYLAANSQSRDARDTEIGEEKYIKRKNKRKGNENKAKREKLFVKGTPGYHKGGNGID